MAELVTSMVVGPLVSMVKEKASSYLLEQYKVMEGMEEQHKILKRKLPAIMDVITDAEEQAAAHREGAKAWLEELKTVAYEANEVFDEFQYEALRREAKKNGHYRKLGFDAVKLFPTHNRIVFRYRMGNKLCRILQAVEVLIAEMNAFRFKFRPQPPVSKQWRQTSSDIYDPMEIASSSRDKDIKHIVGVLVGQASNANLTVVSIVGMGGLGKTTLAQLVYNDPEIRKHFELLLWVCVSDNFDVDSLAKSIVQAAPKKKEEKEAAPKKKEEKEAAPKKKEDTGTRSESPLDSLQQVVSGQKYLLVLDDVWNREADKWDKLKDRLQHGGMGSAVLTTTRDKRVAEIMGADKVYNLAVLGDDFIKKIIKTRAFSLQKEEEKPELVKKVDEIVKRCAGSPLAATALGSVLRTKTRVKEWEAVLSRSNICTEETGILPILKLSYNDLPSHMKPCFAFCAVFPKDYEIDVDKLIRLWIANGFIQEQKEFCLETIGKEVFDELASRSFFQAVKQVPAPIPGTDQSYFTITCKIHDLMHDVALSTMEKERAVTTEKQSLSEWLPKTARHLFCSCQEPETILNDALTKISPAIQTLLCDRSMKSPLQHLSKYRYMRALRLKPGDSFPLKPKHLHHLRYLDLSESYIRALPEDICILYNLQTLNLSGCESLDRLPRQMKYMTSLRHLYTHRCFELKSMPPDLRKLTSLQTLTRFVVGTGSDCSNVGELKNLNLGGLLELHQLENVTKAEDAREANLRNKKELTELILRWKENREEEEQHYDEVLEGLQPHVGLQVLRIYNITSFPTWISKLQNLVELWVCGCKKSQRLPPLWELPELRVLYLAGLKKLQYLCSGDTSFPKLKKLTLSGLPDFEMWCEINGRPRKHAVVFPELEELSVMRCKKMTALPEACSAFPGLKNLSLHALRSFNSWGVAEGTNGGQPTIPLKVMRLNNCNLFFRSGALELWTCFAQLEDLEIEKCDALVHWPEKEFRSLVSLRRLKIKSCIMLTGYAQAPEQSTLERSQLVPRLESLEILSCGNLVEVFNVPASLKKMDIRYCPKLESIFGKQHDTRLVSPDDVARQDEPAVIQETCSDVMESTASDHFLRCLESLEIKGCDSLSRVLNLPPSLKDIVIFRCPRLQVLSGQLDALQKLHISNCNSLTALESCSRELPSLEILSLKDCASLASIPIVPSLRSHNILGCHKLSQEHTHLSNVSKSWVVTNWPPIPVDFNLPSDCSSSSEFDCSSLSEFGSPQEKSWVVTNWHSHLSKVLKSWMPVMKVPSDSSFLQHFSNKFFMHPSMFVVIFRYQSLLGDTLQLEPGVL